MRFHQQRTYKWVFTVVLTSLIASASFAQKSSTNNKPRPFEPSEELTYKAEFSRSLLRKLDVASFKLTVSRIERGVRAKSSADLGTDDTPPYHLKLTGLVESQGFFAKLFGLDFRQEIESTVDPGAFVVQKTVRQDEQGKRVRSSEAIFDHERGQVTWVERDPKDPTRPDRTVINKFEEPVQDILSAIYYLRTRELVSGKVFDVPVSDSGRVYKVTISVGEKKRIKTALGRVPVVRIEPQLFGVKGMIAEDGKFSIWLTDDTRRIPVSARIKLSYGTFDITLKKVLQQPTTQVASTP
jgi:hypothetical protein